MTYRVLIADDEERMRRVLAMVFDEMKDTRVVTTSNCVTTLDCLDKDVTDSETNETRIESCNFCESKNIKWIEGIELTQWQDENFDENGNFKKSSPKTKENLGQFSSIEKLKLINDQLLKNEITIEEYRQRVQEARKEA